MNHKSMLRNPWALTILAALLAVPALVKAAEPVDLEIRRVALFKNGLGFYTATAEIPSAETDIRFAQLPVPVLGTFWVAYDPKLKVTQLVTRADEIEKETPTLGFNALLDANVGREVTLRTGLDGGQVVRGIIVGFLEAEDDDDAPLEPQPRHRIVPQSGPLVLQTDSGTVFLDAGMVRRVDFGPGDVETRHTVTTREPSLNLVLGRPARNDEEIAVSYLAKGATWTPSYLVDLSDPETAKFHASAVIVNEMQDFEDVQLELVTGFPNIRFADVESPLGKVSGLAQFLSSLGGGQAQVRAGMTSQMVSFDQFGAEREFRAPAAPTYSSAAEGQVSEDLFLYPVEEFSLAKGETAWRPLFSAEMPYQHIYTWKIADFVDAHGRYTRGESSGENAEVWHACRLTNTLDQPLTTAATEFVTDGQIVGQDLCHYTAPGAETTIRINRAMNVLVDQIEVEVQRERQATRVNGTYYDLVEVRGELEIENKLDRKIAMEVSKELSGQVQETVPQCEDVTLARGLRRMNENHRLTWKFDLGSNDQVKLTYRYKVYIAS